MLIATVIGTMMIAAEELGEIAYLPLYVFLAIEFAKGRLRRRRKAKALLGGARNMGSR
ncbi:MAG TPA: hypothetical protein VGV69_00925 [Solirubrobacterales bacterium]|nr:hypothetical protein [Solirubrobacterales bacterium]